MTSNLQLSPNYVEPPLDADSMHRRFYDYRGRLVFFDADPHRDDNDGSRTWTPMVEIPFNELSANHYLRKKKYDNCRDTLHQVYLEPHEIMKTFCGDNVWFWCNGTFINQTTLEPVKSSTVLYLNGVPHQQNDIPKPWKPNLRAQRNSDRVRLLQDTIQQTKRKAAGNNAVLSDLDQIAEIVNGFHL